MKTREMISEMRLRAIGRFIGKIIGRGLAPYLVTFGLIWNNQTMLIFGVTLLIVEFIDGLVGAWIRFKRDLKMLEIEEAMLDHVDNLEKENRA